MVAAGQAGGKTAGRQGSGEARQQAIIACYMLHLSMQPQGRYRSTSACMLLMHPSLPAAHLAGVASTLAGALC